MNVLRGDTRLSASYILADSFNSCSITSYATVSPRRGVPIRREIGDFQPTYRINLPLLAMWLNERILNESSRKIQDKLPTVRLVASSWLRGFIFRVSAVGRCDITVRE